MKFFPARKKVDLRLGKRCHRQRDAEGCAAAKNAARLKCATVLRNNAVCRRKSQSYTFANRMGGDERLKQMVAHGIGNAHTIIHDIDYKLFRHAIFAGVLLWPFGQDRRLVQVDFGGGADDLRIGDRVRRWPDRLA